MPEELRKRLRALLLDVTELDEIPETTPFSEVGIHSMMAMEIIAEVERAFGVTISDDSLEDIKNFETLHDHLQAALANGQ